MHQKLMKIHPFHVKKEETGILDEQNMKEWILESDKMRKMSQNSQKNVKMAENARKYPQFWGVFVKI